MEEKMEVRYTFVMLLAIADPTGHVIGTDVAIARRLNMPLAQFFECIEQLGKPDPNSNSKDEEGRRVIPSTGERGYKVVNYPKYRDIKDEVERREYMRKYMQEYRKEKPVNSVNNGKPKLAELTQVDAAVPAEAEADTRETLSAMRSSFWPTEQDIQTEASLRGIPPPVAEAFFNHFESAGWQDKNGHTIKSWRHKLATWWTQEQEKRAKESKYGSNTGRNSGGHAGQVDKRNIMLKRSQEEHDAGNAAVRASTDAFLAEARRNAGL